MVILCIDDEPLIIEAIKRCLLGHQVVGFTDSCAAIGHLVSDPHPRYDVVLCDILMMGCTGADVHRVLSRDRPDLAARTVFMTGVMAVPEVVRFIDSTGCLMLEKPTKSDTLREAVRRAALARPRRKV